MRVILFGLALIAAFAFDTSVHNAVLAMPEGLSEAAGMITWIGKTDWQAIVLICVMIGAALARPDPESAARAERILRLAVACFLLILLTGIAVQVLKYLFGRPRPLALGDLSPLTFAPLSFQSGWNAFPSGHSTTMGALAVLATRIWPKFWFVAWGIALVVGVSRVFVAQHYPSDVVAGLALGAVLVSVADRSLASGGRVATLGPTAPPAAPRPRADFGAFGDPT